MERYRRGELYGIAAEFETVEDLRAAAIRLFDARYRKVHFYTPYPVKGLAGMFRGMNDWVRYLLVSPLIFIGGFVGAATGIAMQEYANLIDFPINIGGRPLNSWPEFIPVTFETTVLFAAFAAVIAMLAGNGLPRLRHPVFNVRDFDLATRNRFFLCIPARDPRFDPAPVRRFLEALEPMRVMEVPA